MGKKRAIGWRMRIGGAVLLSVLVWLIILVVG